MLIGRSRSGHHQEGGPTSQQPFLASRFSPPDPPTPTHDLNYIMSQNPVSNSKKKNQSPPPPGWWVGHTLSNGMVETQTNNTEAETIGLAQDPPGIWNGIQEMERGTTVAQK